MKYATAKTMIKCLLDLASSAESRNKLLIPATCGHDDTFSLIRYQQEAFLKSFQNVAFKS